MPFSKTHRTFRGNMWCYLYLKGRLLHILLAPIPGSWSGNSKLLKIPSFFGRPQINVGEMRCDNLHFEH